MTNRNDYLMGAIAWAAYFFIFMFVYWDVLLCVWRDPTAASWAQGVGTLAAVVIAVWVHIHKLSEDRRREAQDREQQAMAVALSVYPALVEIEARLNVIKTRYESLSEDEQDSPINELKKGLFPDIDIPPSIVRNIDRLQLIGPNLVQAIAIIENLDRFVELAVDKKAAFTPRVLKKHLDRLDLVLPRAKKEAAYFHDLPYKLESESRFVG